MLRANRPDTARWSLRLDVILLSAVFIQSSAARMRTVVKGGLLGPPALNIRATPILPSGWSYMSCVRELSSGRTLTGMSGQQEPYTFSNSSFPSCFPGYSFTSSTMTVDSCVAACANRDYALAGVEYANECYCGNAFAGGSTGGGSVPPESECNMPCAGDATQTCGAGNRLSVYTNGQTVPGAPVLPSGWSSASKCITEASTGRALVGNSFTSQSLTLDQCIDLCDQTGFQYAGAEVSISLCFHAIFIKFAPSTGLSAIVLTPSQRPMAAVLKSRPRTAI